MTEFRDGNGAAWLDLLATLTGRYRAEKVDAIASPSTLRAWLRANRLEPSGAVSATDVTDAADARESLHRLAVAAVDGTTPPSADVRRLNDLLAADAGVQVSVGASGLRAKRPTTVRVALGRLARQAVDDLSGVNHATLRACGDDTCSGIFLDTTGRRRWCSDQSCGNRMRVRAHRQRANS